MPRADALKIYILGKEVVIEEKKYAVGNYCVIIIIFLDILYLIGCRNDMRLFDLNFCMIILYWIILLLILVALRNFRHNVYCYLWNK